MKNVLKIIAILFLFINFSCKAQQMVLTQKDAHKLKENEQQFINKPLKDLLKEIKPQIKMVDGTLNSPDYFTFKFVTHDEYKLGIRQEKNYTSIYVYVKESINWQREKRPKGEEYVWTKEDVKKYGDFTVLWLRVIGKD